MNALALTLVVLTGSAALVAQTPVDVTGQWKTEPPEPAATLDLKVEGAKVTGTLAGPRGNTMPLGDGKIVRNRLTFTVISHDGDRTVSFVGLVNGDAIAFTRTIVTRPGGSPGAGWLLGAGGPPKFTFKRVKPPAR